MAYQLIGGCQTPDSLKMPRCQISPWRDFSRKRANYASRERRRHQAERQRINFDIPAALPI